MKGKSNENDDEKGIAQKLNQKKGFLSFQRHLTVITETQEDSTTIKSYPTTIKPSNEETKGDVRDFSWENHVYTPLAKGKHVYVCDCQEKTRVYV
jgi:hypothetical protein